MKKRLVSSFLIVVFVILVSTWSERQMTKCLMSTFVNDEMVLKIFKSNDGVNFQQVEGVNYLPQNGNHTVRDPSVIQFGDYYYIVYTVVEWGIGNNIGMCRTKDFNQFEELAYLEVGDFYKVWAPAFYTEDDKCYIIFNANISEENQSFQSYIISYDAYKHKVSEPTRITGLPENVIDSQIYKINEDYYLFYKNENTKYVELAKSSSLCGTYEVVGFDDWAGWGNTLEGPDLIRLSNGTFRIYLDNYEEHQIYYSDSENLEYGWTGKKKISPNLIAHPDIVVEH